GVTTGTLTITSPTIGLNGKYYRLKFATGCEEVMTNSAQLTVLPNTSITSNPVNASVCGNVNNSFTVTAAGQPPISYTWQYSADGTEGSWIAVVNETPANATYTGIATSTLYVSGNIAAETYHYRVVVESACGDDVTSNPATLTVNALPTVTEVAANQTRCGAGDVTFTAAPSAGAEIQWSTTTDFTTPTTGNSITVNLASGTTVTYYYRARNTETGCVSAYQTVTGTANALPAAPIAGNVTVSYDGLEHTASATVGTGEEVVWYNAATGGSVLSSAPTATNAGTYTAWAAARNTTTGCESATRTSVTLQINKVALTVTADDIAKCAGTPDPSLTYQITGFVHGETSSVLSGAPTLSRAPGEDAGTYTITPAVGGLTSPNYTFTFVNGTFTINAIPTPIISGNSTVNINTNLTLTTESGMSGYTWSVDTDGSITSGGTTNQITVKWTSAGAKNVTVTYTANDCSGTSNAFVVTVSEQTAPVITGNPSPLDVCSTINSVQFSVTSVSGTPAPTLIWQSSTDDLNYTDLTTGGDYSGVGTTTLTVSNVSSHNNQYFRLKASNDLGPVYSNGAKLTVTQAQTPSVSIVSNAANNTSCSGTSVTFTATASNLGGGNVSYQWKLNGSNVVGTGNPYTTTTLANGDKVRCVITVTEGCVTATTAISNEITNIVNTAPAQPSAITGTQTPCAGTNNVAYSVTNVEGVTYTWQYSGEGETINGSGSSITINFASNATSGTLTVTPHNGDCNGTAQTLAITIPGAISYSDQPDDASVSAGANASFSATASNATIWQWQVSTDAGLTWNNATGGVYSNATTSTLNLTNVTTAMNGYQYKLLSSNACFTSVASNVATLTIEPTNQATNITWVSWNSNQIKFKWTNGNGTARLIIAKQASILTDAPTDGTAYTANNIYGLGSHVGDAFAIGNGDQDTATANGLSANTAYIFKVFEYNGTGSTANYKTDNATGNPRYRKTSFKEGIDEITLILGDKFLLTGIAPNPVSNVLNFAINTQEELRFTIEVQNELGMTVFVMNKDLGIGEYPMNINLGSEQRGQLPAGTYFLRVSAGGETLSQKFIYMP
ncbi:T9SS type A sorting domain-containing protein, partial [bacterium]|nr:T9SS type A sorting domain-containing protein [bacterium]